jgi:arylsulfatase A-like enzyme
LFTGEWAHEHGCYRRDHYLDSVPLTETLHDEGYRTVGTSANVFASSTYGFDRGFDRFYETRRPLNPQGLNPFARVRQLQEDGTAGPADYARTFLDSLTHDHPIASVDNFARSVVLSLDRRFDLRQYLPFFDDEGYGFLTRAADRSTRFLIDEFERAADRPQPLFAFANYMTTHYPYEPPADHFQAVTDGEYDLNDIRAIDPDVSQSQVFRNTAFAGALDEDDLDLVRAAYRAEVRSVDETVAKLLQTLEEAGIRDETIVVITADHGECLGETDLRGERVMGHSDALSEHLWTVPLIVANPKLDATTVETRTSLKNLFDLLTGDLDSFLASDGREWDDYFGDLPVLFEHPAEPLRESSLREYNHLPEWFIERIVATHTVVGFDGERIAVVDSNADSREAHGVRDGRLVDASSVPPGLCDACEHAVTALSAPVETAEHSLSNSVESQLEDLGYV